MKSNQLLNTTKSNWMKKCRNHFFICVTSLLGIQGSKHFSPTSAMNAAAISSGGRFLSPARQIRLALFSDGFKGFTKIELMSDAHVTNWPLYEQLAAPMAAQ